VTWFVLGGWVGVDFCHPIRLIRLELVLGHALVFGEVGDLLALTQVLTERLGRA
jgi:hypothetical protein